MLLYVFLVLGTWKGVLGEDDLCDKYLHEVCVSGDWKFPPATEADMDQMCRQLLQKLDCVEDFSRKCRSDDDINLKFHKDFRTLLEDACREDSQLHSRIVPNIDCFHERFENDREACQEFFEKKENAIINRINSIEDLKGNGDDTNEDDLYGPYGCLISTFEPVCYVVKTSARCGSDTGDLVLELIRRSGLLERSCVLASEERLAEYISLLELELEEETVLNRILDKE